MIFATIYPLYLNRLEKNGRTKEELNQVIKWFTGLDLDERQTLFEKLSSNGRQIMVLLDNYAGSGDYGFGKKFGWCEETYGISWQLNLSE
jgi:predicted 3-demethylubiquinone-9 3-methyltransferase (glyoxalase superfamily)